MSTRLQGKLLILLPSMFVILMLVSLPFMGGVRAASPGGGPIKIGVILPLTGPLALAGSNAKQGIELRLDEVGSKVAGREIKYIYEDDTTQHSICLEKAKKLVESDKVNMLIGGILLEFCIPYTAQVKVPQIGLRPIIPRAGMKLLYTFMPDGTFKMYVYPMAWYAYDKLGFRTASCIAIDRDDGNEQIAAFTEAFQKKGGTVIHKQSPPVGTADFGPYLVALKKADVVVAWFHPPDMVRFLKQYNELGLFKKMPVVIPLCEVLLEGLMPTLGDSILGIKGSCDYQHNLKSPLNEQFVRGIEKKFGARADSYTLGGYEAMSIAIAALEATGGDTNSEKLRQAILRQKLRTPSTETLTFRPDGWGSKDMHIFEVKKTNGKYAWEPIYSYRAVDPINPIPPAK